jgi:stalled ribosome alternative rescue factor ArfA
MLEEKNWSLTQEQKKGKGVVQRKKMVHDQKKWGWSDVQKGGRIIHKLSLNS